jgi:hypothetical protein
MTTHLARSRKIFTRRNNYPNTKIKHTKDTIEMPVFDSVTRLWVINLFVNLDFACAMVRWCSKCVFLKCLS